MDSKTGIVEKRLKTTIIRRRVKEAPVETPVEQNAAAEEVLEPTVPSVEAKPDVLEEKVEVKPELPIVEKPKVQTSASETKTAVNPVNTPAAAAATPAPTWVVKKPESNFKVDT